MDQSQKKCSQALRNIKRDPCSSSLIQAYQSASKKLDTTIQSEKAKCWRSFAAELRPSIPSNKVWKTLRAMEGRRKADVKNQPIENDAGKIFTTDMDKANGMTVEYASVSHAEIDRADSKPAYEEVRKSLRLPVDEPLDLNDGFSNMELTSALLKLKKGAPGLDQIHPLMLKNIADSAKCRLLGLFNRSWLESRVPSDWRKAVIIPIIKKNKPANKIKSYRPVALLSVVSKVLETMIASRMKLGRSQVG